MTTLDLDALATATGGGTTPASACNRTQFDWMVQHMVPDTGLKPGMQRHVVVNDARSCGFPVPK